MEDKYFESDNPEIVCHFSDNKERHLWESQLVFDVHMTTGEPIEKIVKRFRDNPEIVNNVYKDYKCPIDAAKHLDWII